MLSYRVTTTGECFRQRMSEERHSAVKMCLCNSAMRVQKEVNIYIITICMIIFWCFFVQHQSTYGRCCLLLPAHLSFQRRSSGFDLLQTGENIDINILRSPSQRLVAGRRRHGIESGFVDGFTDGFADGFVGSASVSGSSSVGRRHRRDGVCPSKRRSSAGGSQRVAPRHTCRRTDGAASLSW